MDDPSATDTAHAHALKALNRANQWLGVHRNLAGWVRGICGNDSVSVADVGMGGGGFLAHYAQRVDARRVRIGLDCSERAIRQAHAWFPGSFQGIVADARRMPFADNSVDVVTCSLFLHHFDASDAVVVLRESARVARRGVLAADLIRSRLAWLLTWIATRALSRSKIFHIDGPRSVRAAFSNNELLDLARRAGLHDAGVQRQFPFRLVLSWKKVPCGECLCTQFQSM